LPETIEGSDGSTWTGFAFWRKHRVIAGSQPVIQAELHSVFEETFRHAAMGKLAYFTLGHPG
jgi:hypothetical protein